MSQTLPPCTSMCCLCTGTVGSKGRAPSSCGATCSTSAACRASVALCWSARTSWCLFTSRRASRRRARRKSQCPTCSFKRWSTRWAGRHMQGGTAAANLLQLFTCDTDTKDKRQTPHVLSEPPTRSDICEDHFSEPLAFYHFCFTFLFLQLRKKQVGDRFFSLFFFTVVFSYTCVDR